MQKGMSIGVLITIITICAGVLADYVRLRFTVEEMKTSNAALAEAVKPLVIDYQVKEELKKRGLWHNAITMPALPTIPPTVPSSTIESITREKTNAFNVSQFPQSK